MSRVFICWSGEPSKSIATVLRHWIPQVLQATQPWMSDTDIAKGAKWEPELTARLKESVIGILCLTSSNLKEPWILFEAGALSTAMEHARVIPYLFDLEPANVSPPLSIFQASKADEIGTKRLMDSINGRLDKAALEPDRLAATFKKWWPELSEDFQKIRGKRRSTQPPPERSEREMMVEMLGLMRGLRERLDRPRYWGGDWVSLPGTPLTFTPGVSVEGTPAKLVPGLPIEGTKVTLGPGLPVAGTSFPLTLVAGGEGEFRIADAELLAPGTVLPKAEDEKKPSKKGRKKH